MSAAAADVSASAVADNDAAAVEAAGGGNSTADAPSTLVAGVASSTSMAAALLEPRPLAGKAALAIVSHDEAGREFMATMSSHVIAVCCTTAPSWPRSPARKASNG